MDDDKKGKPDQESNLKEVAKVWGPVEAEVIKSFLESQGIPCLLRGLVVQSVHPFSADGLGEIRIMVREEDFSTAEKLLQEIEINREK
jgi:hypothetical protein